MNAITLKHVTYLPAELSAGILYVSEEYGVAGHLCPCGCGTKVITPLGEAEWTFSERKGRPTLQPSVGNWQLPCQSHYVIKDGQIRCAGPWSREQIERGRRAEEDRRRAYYASRTRKRSVWKRLRDLVQRLLGRL